LRVIALQVDEP